MSLWGIDILRAICGIYFGEAIISNNGGYATPHAQDAEVANYRPRSNPSTHMPKQSAYFLLGRSRFRGVTATAPPNYRKLFRHVAVARSPPPRPPTSCMRDT